MALSPPELTYLLIHYINLREDYIDEIETSHTCFDYKKLKH